jgi:DNA-binding NtrC family response regulator
VNTLVVDDEVIIRWFIERILSKRGHSIVCAESVDAARLILDGQGRC